MVGMANTSQFDLKANENKLTAKGIKFLLKIINQSILNIIEPRATQD